MTNARQQVKRLSPPGFGQPSRVAYSQRSAQGGSAGNESTGTAQQGYVRLTMKWVEFEEEGLIEMTYITEAPGS